MPEFKKVGTDRLEPGMRVARSIENRFGAVLITPKMILDSNLIKKLRTMGFEEVTVFDETDEQVEKNRYDYIEQYQNNVVEVKNLFASINRRNKLDFQHIREIVDKTFQIDTNRDVINMLSSIRNNDEYTYTHSINVGLLAMLLGHWAKLNENIVKALLYAGLLHDIGKSRISDKILNKKGCLSPEEFEVIKKHSVYGYEMVKECPYISDRIAKAVLLHHERCNGSGYPFGFTKGKIPFMARVLAIIDTFDAMTSDRVYKDRRPPFTVFKLFEEDLRSYDLLLTRIFMGNMAQYYLGEMVELSDGSQGEIVFINKNIISEPIVCIDDEYIDLSDSEMEIADLLPGERPFLKEFSTG
ncbi:MAG TPA: HD-GYP domain-containing protein [Halanaerobiales bacterium]|nr:HD-GYP domain-containing protein [Halanaerobiales bacterium]